MQDEKNKTIYFEEETKYKIGNVTYLVIAHYDENGETLKEKMKQLLFEKIAKEVAANNW